MDGSRRPTNHLSRGRTYVGDKADNWDENSTTKTYYRMEAKDAAHHWDTLTPYDKEKLESDERRIRQTKARLAQQPGNMELLDAVRRSFQEWRTEAVRSKRLEDTQDRLVKPQLISDPRLDVKSEIEDNPAHDIKAGFMFFEKHGQNWKGATYHGQSFPANEKFPNQKLSVQEALYGEEHNPFPPQTDDMGAQYLRYIHLPANHMAVSHTEKLAVHYVTMKLMDEIGSGSRLVVSCEKRTA